VRSAFRVYGATPGRVFTPNLSAPEFSSTAVQQSLALQPERARKHWLLDLTGKVLI
jgi:hypothetical protein